MGGLVKRLPICAKMMADLTKAELQSFMVGQQLYAFDPMSLERVGHITYQTDGRCVVVFEDGTADQGDYGLLEASYWTQYAKFRDGKRNEFYLLPLDLDVAQAFFADGRRAFVQTPRASLGADFQINRNVDDEL